MYPIERFTLGIAIATPTTELIFSKQEESAMLLESISSFRYSHMNNKDMIMKAKSRCIIGDNIGKLSTIYKKIGIDGIIHDFKLKEK